LTILYTAGTFLIMNGSSYAVSAGPTRIRESFRCDWHLLDVWEIRLVLTNTSPGVSSFSVAAFLLETRNFENMVKVFDWDGFRVLRGSPVLASAEHTLQNARKPSSWQLLRQTTLILVGPLVGYLKLANSESSFPHVDNVPYKHMGK